MGRGTSNGGSVIYLRIANGKVVETVTADHEKAVMRINKNNKTVYERHDDFVEGVITSMHERTGEIGGEETKELNVRIHSGGEDFQLSLKEGSRQWSSFAMRLPNLDLTKPVRFSPYDFEAPDTGDRIIGMNVFQDGVKVPSKWTKDNPGKLPQGEVVKVKGKKDQWNFYERDQFLLTVIRHFAGQLKQEDEAMGGEHGAPVQQNVTNDPPATYAPPRQPDATVPPSMRPPLPTNPNPDSYQGDLTTKSMGMGAVKGGAPF